VSAETPPPPAPGHWLNRTVVGAGVTSFLADVGYEMATALLPGFLLALGVTAAPAMILLLGRLVRTPAQPSVSP